MRTLLSIPIHGDERRKLFDRMIAPALLRHDSIVPLLIGDDCDRQRAAKWGLHFIEYPNRPLGAKFNAGCYAAIQLGCTHMMIQGSDDIIDEAAYNAMMLQDADVVGWTDIYFYDLKSEQLKYWPGYDGQREGDTIGCGRMVTVELIERLGGKLYEDNRNKGLDGSMTRRIKQLKDVSVVGLSLPDHDAFMCDVKGADNIWSFDHIDYQAVMVDADKKLIEKYVR